MKNHYTAFDGTKIFTHGPLEEVLLKIKRKFDKQNSHSILIFSDETGKTMDFNFQGSEKDVLARVQIFIAQEPQQLITGPGRPKLGVVSREISLLPRHWEWLANQTGGASATLRRLIETERKKTADQPNTKTAQESTYRFMNTIAGDFPGFEEAIRYLYKKDFKKFSEYIESWPNDIKKHIVKLSSPVFK